MLIIIDDIIEATYLDSLAHAHVVVFPYFLFSNLLHFLHFGLS